MQAVWSGPRQALIPIFKLNLDRARNTLSFLLGMPPSNLESLLGEAGKIPVAPETVAVGIPAELLRRRPDVRAAEMAAAKEVQDGLQGFLRTREEVEFLQKAVTASDRAVKLALEQYNQGATDYTRVLNTQTALLAQQDSLTSARGQVVSSLVATYKALGGGWQLREGQSYVKPGLINSMQKRTDWGEILTSPEQ